MIDDESREIGFLAGKEFILEMLADVLGVDVDNLTLTEMEEIVFARLEDMIGDLNQAGLW